MQHLQIRHQVAIVGRVTNAQTLAAIAIAEVQITSAPQAFVAKLIIKAKLVTLVNEPTEVIQARTTLDNADASNAQKLQAAQQIIDFLVDRKAIVIEILYKTLTAADGLFYFMDLPDGEYTLTASVPSARQRYSSNQVESVKVSRNDRGDIAITVADITLPSTTLIGQITHGSEANTEPVFLAKVLVKGTQESAYSNSQGQYILSGLEASTRQRTIVVWAQGYKPSEGTVTLLQPGEQQSLNLELTPLMGNP